MIEQVDRAEVTRLHGVGLLGATGIGWFIAALYCLVRLTGAVRRREALLVLQSAQTALFQLGSGVILFGLVGLALVGFLVLGGAVDFLPELPFVISDPFSLAGIVALCVWLLSLLAVPLWHLWSLRQVVLGWRRSSAGELFAYPFVGPLVWEEAPRVLKWMVIHEAQEPIESAE